MARKNEKDTPTAVVEASKTTEVAEIAGNPVTVTVIDTVADSLPTAGLAEGYAIFELCDKGSSWGYGDYHLANGERKSLPKDNITLRGVNSGAIREVVAP
jgi:hypothetical protein